MDNEYPNPGEYFLPQEPQAQVNESKSEKGKVQAAMPMLEDIIAHMKDRIAFYDSVKSIPQEHRNTTDDFRVHFEANSLTKANLEIVLNWIEELKDTHS